MRIKTLISIVIGLLLIGLLLWLGVYAYDNIVISNPAPDQGQQAETQPPAVMTAFLVMKPNLVVDSSSLGKVEIWYTPTGTDISEADQRLIGNAVLQPGSDPSIQIWTLPIPENQFLATDIFAKGFDDNGVFVGRLSLPYIGATQIHDALWVGAPVATSSPSGSTQRNFSFTLKVGQQSSAGPLTLQLLKITGDSRCPQGAVCVWAGEVSAQVALSFGGKDPLQKKVILSSSGQPYSFGGYSISIAGVGPVRSGIPPAPSDYRVTFSIQKL